MSTCRELKSFHPKRPLRHTSFGFITSGSSQERGNGAIQNAAVQNPLLKTALLLGP